MFPGNLATVTDSETGIVTTYYYDLLNRQSGYREKGTNLDHSVKYEYDGNNNLASMTETVGGVTKTYTYTYDEDNRLISESIGEPVVSELPENNINITYSYDGFGRLQKRVVKNGDSIIQSITPTYSAGKESGTTAGQVRIYNGYTYTYDKNGNILSVRKDAKTTSYVYDSANQLIRENNQELGFTHTWTYDNAGNIMERKEYAYTTGALGAVTDTVVYNYNGSAWGDMLKAYDGNTISYDGVGNPTSDGTWSYTWQHGRELVSMSDGTTTWTYTYDADGMRTKRTNGTNTYTYVYNGSKLTQMSVGNYTFDFTYDASGIPLTITLNDYTYYYVTNLQGDVIGILDEDGNQVITYHYTAWGEVTYVGDDQIGWYNPLRYRGYVYDNETSLYYLQSRYYNPEWGRFINADGLVSTGQGLLGNNMFAYCGNNPIIRADQSGNSWLLTIGIGIVTQYASDVLKNVCDGKTGKDIFAVNSTAGEYIAAGVTALIPGKGVEASLIRNMVTEVITVTEDSILGNQTSILDSAINVAIGTTLDTTFEKFSDEIIDYIDKKKPQNYSSYAHDIRQSSPYLTRRQVYSRMQRAIRFNRILSKAASKVIDIVRGTLPY